MTTEAQYLLASIVESSQDSIVSINVDRIITSWNKGAERLYGFTAEEVIGRPLSMAMLPEDIQDLIAKVNNIIAEVTVPIYDTVRILKNGRNADLEILLSPVRDVSGNVVGISTVARDITLRKMNEQRKDDFISVASHELKTPVTGLKVYADVLLEHFETAGDEFAVSIIKKLGNQVDNLIDLIKTLLDTTKLAAGDVLLNTVSFDLDELIAEQIEPFKLITDRHNFVFNAGILKPISADRKLIGQVLTNIITNAVKYSPSGSKIVIASNETDLGAEVSVQDFGIGISKEAQEKIFERHFRATDPLVKSISGVGLGLYITAGIIRQHGGSISVAGEEGKGSTFSFTLPYNDLHRQNLNNTNNTMEQRPDY